MLASYAVAVALNSFLPANIGTLVMMLMFVTLIAGATFAAVFSGFVVQKIPFTVLSVAVYVYLFATVPGSLSIELGFLSEHPVVEQRHRRRRRRAAGVGRPIFLAPRDEAAR